MIASLVQRVRDVSRAGHVVRLDEVWPGSADELWAALESEAAATRSGDNVASLSRDDIALVAVGAHTYLYSDRAMTPRYAEMAARAAGGDVRALVADAVRFDSATYPRPTSIEVFASPPFNLSTVEVDAAVAQMAGAPAYSDIALATASDGSRFLYSSRHLTAAHAESLAEWIAVGRAENP